MPTKGIEKQEVEVIIMDRVQKRGEVVPKEIRDTVSARYHCITKAVNREFWNSTNDTLHSLYVGSYGRGTAIDTSDVDMLVILPQNVYEQHDRLKGNGQSRLLQAVKGAIQSAYPRSNIRADGQVVVIDFADGIKFEVVPAFEREYVYPYYKKKFIYPDTNNGGNWKSTNPKAEQEAMNEKNDSSNGLLKDTCRHIRRIYNEKFSSYHLSGILIDSFVYRAIQNWRWTPPGGEGSASGTYENVLYDYYNANKWSVLYAPGSGMSVDTDDYFCLEKILKYMAGK